MSLSSSMRNEHQTDGDYRPNVTKEDTWARFIPPSLFYFGLTTGQRAQWAGATSCSGGNLRAQSGTRNPQRGSKEQPGGMACSGGTVPSMVSSGWERFVFRSGTECRSPRG